MTQRALLVVDLQNDYFPGGKLPLVGIEAAAGKAARVIEAARAAGDPVVHIRHEFPSPQAPFFAAGSPGAAIHPTVVNREGEPVVVKQVANAFQETNLKALLDARKIDEVVMVGAMSHMCIDAAARAAKDFGYAVTVIHDACATRDLEFDGVKVAAAQVHAAFMAALASSYASVVSTEAHLAAAAAA